MKEPFLESLSEAHPVPGGGSAAAYGGSTGLALLKKVVRLELNRCEAASSAGSFWKDRINRLETLEQSFKELRDQDGAAYSRLTEARGSGDTEARGRAVREAIDCPMRIMEAAREALNCTVRVAERCKKHLLADLLVVCELFQASALGAYHIACSNLPGMDNEAVRRDYKEELDRLYEQEQTLYERNKETIFTRQAGDGKDKR